MRAAGVWAAIVAALLLVPGDGLTGSLDWLPRLPDLVHRGLDDLVHLVLFWMQAWLLWPLYSIERSWWRGALVVAGCAGYAGLLEVAQIVVPGRGFEVSDIVAGVLGAVLAVFAREWAR